MEVLFGIIGVVMDILAPTPFARTFWALFILAAALAGAAVLLRGA